MPNDSLAILSLLSLSREPLQMKDIRAQLDIPRSSAFRLVEDLLAEGWLVASGSPRRYSSSWKTAALGLGVVQNHPQRGVLFPQLVGLAEEAGLPAHLAFYENGELYFPDLVEVLGGRVVHTAGIPNWEALGRSGGQAPASGAASWEALALAAGRAILAYKPAEELEAALARGVIRRTEFTKTGPAELRAEVMRTREVGYATAINEVRVGSGGIASPILGDDGEPVAALGLHGIDRVNMAQIEAAAVILLKWARRASTLVGGRTEALVS